jgi:hypothetical protein
MRMSGVWFTRSFETAPTAETITRQPQLQDYMGYAKANQENKVPRRLVSGLVSGKWPVAGR